MDVANELLRMMRTVAPGETDGELLSRYHQTRDEAAFAEIVRRNGPLVLRVCRSILGEATAAEDAFQAAFLVLSRKAARLSRPGSLAGWLHATASRVARETRRAEDRLLRRQAECQPHHTTTDDLTWREVREVLDIELAKLPEKYRVPLILCYFQGLSYEEAGRQAGCSVGALRGRLERGKDQLRKRLAKHGLPLAAPVLILAPTNPVSAALMDATLGAVRMANSSGILPRMINNLLGGQIRFRAAPVAFAAAAIGAVLTAGNPMDVEPLVPPTEAARVAEERAAPPMDQSGDPLPPGAIARMGSERFRHSGGAGHTEFALGGKLLISSSGTVDGVVNVWDAKSGRLLRQFRVSDDWMPYLFRVIDDRKLIVVRARFLSDEDETEESSVLVFDLQRNTELRSYSIVRRQVDQAVHIMAIAPDGSRFAAVDYAVGKVWLWDVNGKPAGLLDNAVTDLDEYNTEIAFSQDGKTIYLATAAAISAWDAVKGKRLRTFGGENTGRYELTASADGKYLAELLRGTKIGDEAARDALRIWNPVRGELVKEFSSNAPDSVNRIVACRSGFTKNSVWTARVQAKSLAFRRWEIDTGRSVQEWSISFPGAGDKSIALSPDGARLAVCLGNVICLFDATTGKIVTPLSGHWREIRCLQFTADGRRLATSGRDSKVRTWDVQTGKQVGIQNGNGMLLAPAATAFFEFARTKGAPGQRATNSLSARQLETGQQLWSIPIETITPILVASPDGKTIWGRIAESTRPGKGKREPGSGGDQPIAAIDVATGKIIRTLSVPTWYGPVHIAVGGGGHLVACFNGKEATGWEAASGRNVLRVERRPPPKPHMASIGGSCFVPGWKTCGPRRDRSDRDL